MVSDSWEKLLCQCINNNDSKEPWNWKSDDVQGSNFGNLYKWCMHVYIIIEEAKWANPEKLKILFMKPQRSKVGFRQPGHFSSA